MVASTSSAGSISAPAATTVSSVAPSERRTDERMVRPMVSPVTRDDDYLTLFARWRLGVLVVAANRLGAINHTLLTVRAIRAAGLELRGVVLNEVDPAPPDVARATNLEALRELLDGTPVVPLSWLAASGDDAGVERAATQSALATLLDARPHTEPMEVGDPR